MHHSTKRRLIGQSTNVLLFWKMGRRCVSLTQPENVIALNKLNLYITSNGPANWKVDWNGWGYYVRTYQGILMSVTQCIPSTINGDYSKMTAH